MLSFSLQNTCDDRKRPAELITPDSEDMESGDEFIERCFLQTEKRADGLNLKNCVLLDS